MKTMWKYVGVLAAVLLVAVCVAFSLSGEVSAKYVDESEPIKFGFNVLSYGDDVSQTIGDLCPGVESVVFGYAKNYSSIWDPEGGKPIDCQHDGSIRAFASGKTVYVLSEEKIYAHPWCTRMFAGDAWPQSTNYNQDLGQISSVSLSGNFDTSFMVYCAGMFQGNRFSSMDVSWFNTNLLKDCSNMFTDCKNMTSVKVNWGATPNLHSAQEMFWACEKLNDVSIKWDTKDVGLDNNASCQFYGMFWGCASLESVNVSGWNVRDTFNCTEMFHNCTKLKKVNIDWSNAGNIKYALQMFANCTALESVTLKGWTGLEVAEEMFAGCTNLKSVNFTDTTMSSLKSAKDMFSGCTSLTNIAGIEDWQTGNIGTFENMFKNCASLESLNLNKWDVSCPDHDPMQVTIERWARRTVTFTADLKNMFYGCTKLSNLRMAGWDVSNVHNMEGMLQNCASLETLYISRWTPVAVTNTKNMFNGCARLTTIVSADDSDWSYVTAGNSSGMFKGCVALQGSNGTAYDAGKINSVYAVRDGLVVNGAARPGYFTAPSSFTPPAGYVMILADLNTEDGTTMVTLRYDEVDIPDGYAFYGWYVNKGNGGELYSDGEFIPFEYNDTTKTWMWTIGLIWVGEPVTP